MRCDREMEAMMTRMNTLEYGIFDQVKSLEQHIAGLDISITRAMQKLEAIETKTDMTDLRIYFKAYSFQNCLSCNT